jgi:ribonuclease HI
MLDRECERLTHALQETIAEKVPNVILGPQAKRWWTKELGTLRKDMLKSRRKACKDRKGRDSLLWKKFKEARRKFGWELESTKKNHWRDWLERATDPDLWTANRYITAPPSDCGKTRIPELTYTSNEGQCRARSNEEKGRVLAKTFFPEKPSTINVDGPTETPTPICTADPISREQVKRALARLKLYKAPGPDGIPNIVLTKCADMIESRLWYIFTAIVDKGWYFAPWKNFMTVVLRKPGKPRYDVPKAYRPIALLNTLGKVLTSIIAEQLTYYTEKYALLPPLHFGGRPARTTSNTIHYLVYKIKDAWRKKQVTSVLFLDIEGAFPNAVNEKLISNLTTRRVPTVIIRFVKNMLKGRTTCLKFDNHESDKIHIDNGIGQGDPLSMVLYQYYNADLLDIPNTPQEFAAAYVDDAIIVTTAKTFEDTHKILVDMMTREGGALQWASEHNSRFELTKLALLDFAHHCKKVNRPPLQISETTIKASSSVKYLGVYLDQHLNWKEQEAHATKKGAIWAAQIRRVVRPDWGLTPKFARQMYISVALPRILYAADVWAPPMFKPEHAAKTDANRRFTTRLSTIQRAGTLAVVGGLRTSPSDALCMHADILPTHLELDKLYHQAAARMATLPHSHPIMKIFQKSSKCRVKRHRAPLHQLTSAYNLTHEDFETITVAGHNPALMGKQPFRTDIQDSKDSSKETDKQAPENIKIYTNGSAQDGKVGAAAIMTRDGKTLRVLHFHLGTADKHTVFEAELVGILMGLHLIEANKKGNISFSIGADNQAAIKALTSKFDKPGHYLAAEVFRTAERIRKKRGKKYSLTIRWTAGHSGIPGNEEADEEAKKAAEGKSTDPEKLPKLLRKWLKISRSASIATVATKRKKRWRREWIASPRYAKFKHIDPTLPSRKFIKLISNTKISRVDASKIFQMRSGHAPLNTYLHRFKRKESSQCPACGAPKETPQHFLLECPAYAHERWKLRPKRGVLETKFAELLTSEKKIIALAHYMKATRRFALDEQEKAAGRQEAEIQRA